MSVKDLIKNEVDRLPENALIQVYEFIQSPGANKDIEDYVRSSQVLSVSSFQRIWDNDDDSAYDDL